MTIYTGGAGRFQAAKVSERQLLQDRMDKAYYPTLFPRIALEVAWESYLSFDTDVHYHGTECKVCGSPVRYLETDRCVYCNRQTAAKSYEASKAAANEEEQE